MEPSLESFQHRLIEKLNGYPQAVDAIVDFCRNLWWIALEKPEETRTQATEQNQPRLAKKKKKQNYWLLPTKYRKSLGIIADDSDLLASCIAQLDLLEICRQPKQGDLDEREFRVLDFRTMLVIPRALLGGIRADSDLRYFVMRSLRKKYSINLSAETVRRFHILGAAIGRARAQIQDQINNDRKLRKNATRLGAIAAKPGEVVPQPRKNAPKSGKDAPKPGELSARVDFLRLYSAVTDILQAEQPWKDMEHSRQDMDNWIRLFFECRWAVGVVNLAFGVGSIKFDTDAVDTEFLVCKLFAIPTSISGFDELFVGGLILAEKPFRGPSRAEDEPVEQALFKGRTVYIKGMVGNGKSLLAIQLAAEIARKGGISHVLLFEQTVAECLYVLRSMKAIPDEKSVTIAFTPKEIADVLSEKDPTRGAIVLVHGRGGDFHVYLENLRQNASMLTAYPLRALVVDPINSVHRRVEDDAVQLRADAVRAIWDLKKSGTNLILVAEEGTEGQFLFEENIADTVIRLWTEQKHGYSRRYFQIFKSRFQREQRGPHPFSILPDSGIAIYASPAAVSARISPRSVLAPSESPFKVSMGVGGLDELLGADPAGLYPGDVVALMGPQGSLKSQIGLLFLLAPNRTSGNERQRSSNGSLIVTPRDQEVNIEHLMEQRFVKAFRARTKKEFPTLQICTFGGKSETPGAILQRIEDKFESANQKGIRIDRVVVDDIAYWDLGYSMINEDGQFAAALIELLRSKRVTSLFICNQRNETGQMTVQKEVVDGSDTVIVLQLLDYRGDRRVVGRVETTRDMRHRREPFGIVFDDVDGIKVVPTSSLLRTGPGERVRPIPVRLLLHSESNAQTKYNERIEDAVGSVLSTDTKIVAQHRILEGKATSLGESSAVDQLQILQMDEFQLPVVAQSRRQQRVIHEFLPAQWKAAEWGDFFRRMVHVCKRGNGRFFAVPYYANVGLLAFAHDENGELAHACESWPGIVAACARWERNNENTDGVFFDFARVTPETYNCLFLEIFFSLLASSEPASSLMHPFKEPERKQKKEKKQQMENTPKKQKGPDSEKGRKKELLALLKRAEAHEAAWIMRKLCFRSERAQQNTAVDARAIVSRHWYTTLNEWMRTMSDKDRRAINLRPLPNKISMAGEWFLTIPSHSAAYDVGLEVIKLLTSREAELERLQLGVGLPMRESFYRKETGSAPAETLVSPFFVFDRTMLGDLVENAIRRSDIANYAKIAGVLTSQLKAIVAIPDGDEVSIRQKITERLADLQAHLDFIYFDPCGETRRSPGRS